MNAETTLAQDIKALMDSFDKARSEWIAKYGNDQGFNDWFVKKALSRVK